MSRAKHVIIGIHITDRVKHAGDVQKVLTGYGCIIRTRLGLHEVDATSCSPNGLVVLEVAGTDSEYRSIARKLKAIKGVQVQQMVFTHP